MSSDPIVRILRQVAPANRDVQFESAGVSRDGVLEQTYIGVVVVPLMELDKRLRRQGIQLSELTCRPNSDGSALRLFVYEKKPWKMKIWPELIISILLVITCGIIVYFKTT